MIEKYKKYKNKIFFNIYTGKTALSKADRSQNNLLGNMVEFKHKSGSRSLEGKEKTKYL